MHSCGNTAIYGSRLKLAQLLGQLGVRLSHFGQDGADVGLPVEAAVELDRGELLAT
jgi:hypothetical protein